MHRQSPPLCCFTSHGKPSCQMRAKKGSTSYLDHMFQHLITIAIKERREALWPFFVVPFRSWGIVIALVFMREELYDAPLSIFFQGPVGCAGAYGMLSRLGKSVSLQMALHFAGDGCTFDCLFTPFQVSKARLWLKGHFCLKVIIAFVWAHTVVHFVSPGLEFN